MTTVVIREDIFVAKQFLFIKRWELFELLSRNDIRYEYDENNNPDYAEIRQDWNWQVVRTGWWVILRNYFDEKLSLYTVVDNEKYLTNFVEVKLD